MESSFETMGSECWRIVLALDPVPAARPRVGRFGAYYPKTYSRFKIMADEILVPMAVGRVPSDDLFFVDVRCVGQKPKTSILPAPNGDIDNFVKSPLDAITKAQVLWSDDKQVMALHAIKRWAGPTEGAHIVITAGLTAGAVWLSNCVPVGLGEGDSEDIMDHYDRVELV